MNPRVSNEVRMAGVLPPILKFIRDNIYHMISVVQPKISVTELKAKSCLHGFLPPLLLWDAG